MATKQSKSVGAKAPATSGRSGAPTYAVTEGRPTGPTAVLKYAVHFREKALPALMEKFGYSNVMQAPRLTKIVVNMGVGDAVTDIKNLDIALNELAIITGQKPSVRRSKKAISNFKLRAGLPIGVMVTLRRARMWEFYDRLVSVAVPRIRDFRGLSQRSFDGRGNYTVGFTEQIIFPEINIEKISKVRGMDVTIVTSAKNDEEGRELLRLMQFPFRQR